tara:strand:+ start:578 stop:1003 length:426 start_codon:yes stop_codon:yes gene_type:complete
MAINNSKRLNIVISYLYPNLINNIDYNLQNDSDGKGTYLIWHNTEITKPTDKKIADEKENAMNDYWWKLLRKKRDKLLMDSDWSQVADIPSDLKTSYVTYRNDLRDLPTAVSKPNFDTLNNQEVNKWIEDINSLMPSNPKE